MSPHHDASYKYLFSSPEMVRDLITGFIPDPWLQSLDYATLEKVPGSYVTDDLRHRSDDVVWRVKVGGHWVYLYLLIEFQSTIDNYMGFHARTLEISRCPQTVIPSLGVGVSRNRRKFHAEPTRQYKPTRLEFTHGETNPALQADRGQNLGRDWQSTCDTFSQARGHWIGVGTL